jgi:hypothetical protein
MFGVLDVSIIFQVHANWKDIKKSFVDIVDGLKTGGWD